MTVSRVLRQDRHVAPATRERVLAAAAQLGYQPDPQLAIIMNQLREKRRRVAHETIAVIREAETGADLPSPTYQYVPIQSIRERAARYGYLVEEFWLGVDGMTPARMNQVLRARGICGVIASPQSNAMPLRELDYTRLAAATFGYGLRIPSLHRSAGNMTLAMHLATRQLHDRGYQRIGLALSKWVESRAENAYTATLLRYQIDLPARRRVPPFLFTDDAIVPEKQRFLDWVDRHRPDALISFDQWIPAWLAAQGLYIPRDIALVVHDWTPAMTAYAGLYHRREHVAAAAVDLVVAQLMQHESGIPEVPRQILIPPEWRDGPSVAGQQPPKPPPGASPCR